MTLSSKQITLAFASEIKNNDFKNNDLFWYMPSGQRLAEALKTEMFENNFAYVNNDCLDAVKLIKDGKVIELPRKTLIGGDSYSQYGNRGERISEKGETVSQYMERIKGYDYDYIVLLESNHPSRQCGYANYCYLIIPKDTSEAKEVSVYNSDALKTINDFLSKKSYIANKKAAKKAYKLTLKNRK